MGCSDSISGGSAGEVGNPKIAVVVVDTSGAPVESVSIVALKSNFNPFENKMPESQYTDSSGFVLIDLPDTGSYTINGRSKLRGSAFISLPVIFSQNTIDTIFDTIKGIGAINIILSDTAKLEGRFFYLAGTLHYISLSEAVQTQSGLMITIDSVPEGIVPALILYDTLDTKMEKTIVDTMTVMEGDSNNVDISVVSDFFTSTYLQENALGVRGVTLDTSGLRWIACSTTIIYELASSKWATYNLSDQNYSGDISSILIDNSNVVWFGGSGGIIRHFYDSVGAYWQFWDDSKEHLLNDTIITMGRNSIGNRIWVATPNGITSYRESDTLIILADTVNINMSKITCITEAKRNGAWIGTSEGEIVNLLENNSLANYQLSGSGIDTCSILSMDEDEDTTLWIVSDKKVISFNNGSWEIVNPEVYCNLKVKQVAVNRSNNSIWFISDAALCRLEGGYSSIIYSDEFEYPLTSIDFPSNSIDGVGYVGMRKGVVEIR